MSSALKTFRFGSTRPLLAALLVLLGVVGSLARDARADALDGALEVQSAFVSLTGGVYQLNARVRYPDNAQTAAALRDGMTLFFDLDVEVTRERRFWTNATVIALSLRRELSYHSVTERFVVRDPLVSEQRTFATLDEALQYIGGVDAWPILVAAQTPGGDCKVAVRASIHRGKLTDALRALMFWSDDWQRTSEWYSWSLPR